ncbi:MAG: macrocin O-methyltransferase [Candidatus Omnitrophica bacterium]|nr:macrocin O-methyltransferase [Candidatus Omnitrophota bacterium]
MKYLTRRMKIKRIVYDCFDRLVRTVFRVYTRDPLYSGYVTQASYSPWIGDKSFIDLFSRIEAMTVTAVERYRSYSLWMLVQQTSKLKGALIEIGTWRGGSGALIAKRATMCGITDNVYLCDTFTGVVKAGDQDPHYKGGEFADTSLETVNELLRVLGVENVTVLKGIFPDETSSMIKEQQIRFCHVDVDTYDSAKDILNWVWPRLCRGGMLVYDDFGFHTTQGIRKHVEEQLDIKDRVVIHNLTGQAIVIKIA